MKTPSFDIFQAGLGKTLDTFEIPKRLGLTQEECFQLLSEKDIGAKWPLRSILLNELSAPGVRNTLSSDNPENQTGTFSIQQLIKRIAEYTGANEATLSTHRKQMLPFLHEDTKHILYALEASIIPSQKMKKLFSPAYAKGGAQQLFEETAPYMKKIAELEETNFPCATYAESTNTDKALAIELLDSYGIKHPYGTTAIIPEQVAKEKTTKKTKKAAPKTNTKKAKEAVTPKPGHLLKTKLANQINQLPSTSKNQFIQMVKAFVPESEIRADMDLASAIKLVPTQVLMENFNAEQYIKETKAETLIDSIDIEALLKVVPKDQLHTILKTKSISENTESHQYLDQQEIIKQAKQTTEPTLDNYVSSLSKEQKTSIESFIATM